MALKFKELWVLQVAETVAHGVWQRVVRWETFVREAATEYATDSSANLPLFTQEEFEWLAGTPNTQYLMPNTQYPLK
jgi:hypothetical protein